MNYLISVIVPIYNMEAFLPRCLDSLVNQTYANLEIILVNDGSTDNSRKICENYSKKYNNILVIHKENGGLSSARNAGIKKANGTYIGFVDSDDWVCPMMYEKLLNATHEDSKMVVSASLTHINKYGNKYQKSKNRAYFSNEEYMKTLLLREGDCSVCTKLFHRSIFNTHIFAEGILNEDLLFMTELALDGWGVTIVPDATYYYYERAGSISRIYGKSIEDMVYNARFIKQSILCYMPELSKEVMSFALFQHMAYLLVVPVEKRNKMNTLYTSSVLYVRKNFISEGLFNRFIKIRYKIAMFLLSVMPTLTFKMRSIFRKRSK